MHRLPNIKSLVKLRQYGQNNESVKPFTVSGVISDEVLDALPVGGEALDEQEGIERVRQVLLGVL